MVPPLIKKHVEPKFQVIRETCYLWTTGTGRPEPIWVPSQIRDHKEIVEFVKKEKNVSVAYISYMPRSSSFSECYRTRTVPV